MLTCMEFICLNESQMSPISATSFPFICPVGISSCTVFYCSAEDVIVHSDNNYDPQGFDSSAVFDV